MEIIDSIGKLFDGRKASVKSDNLNNQFCSNITQCKINMFRLAKGILHNDVDAEDAVSQAILKAYEKLYTLRNMESFKPWIMKILVNEAYAISNRRKQIALLDEVEPEQDTTINEHRELWSLVEGLDEEFRVVTILFYYEDLSLREISKVLDLPMGTVKSRLSRARNKLKEIIVDEGSV